VFDYFRPPENLRERRKFLVMVIGRVRILSFRTFVIFVSFVVKMILVGLRNASTAGLFLIRGILTGQDSRHYRLH